MQIQFQVDDKVFDYPHHLIQKQSFSISACSHEYSVHWDDAEPWQEINAQLRKNKNNILLIDKNIYKHYADKIDHPHHKIFIAKVSEDFKTLFGCMEVLNFIQHHEFTKSDTLVVVGGGVMGDVCGLVAGLYKRGVPWVFFPTTLLAMSDSCIGGKVSANCQQVKNQIGIFYPPQKVFINPHFLQSLPTKDIRSGLAEILKMAVTTGPACVEQFRHFVQNGSVANPEYYKPLIFGALAFKKVIIEADEYEKQYRKVLNYGHTFGHAVEALSHFKIPHGIAIAIGMVVANSISYERGLLSSHLQSELAQLCKSLISPVTNADVSTYSQDNLLHILQQDKKIKNDLLSLVLIKACGQSCFLQVPVQEAISELIT